MIRLDNYESTPSLKSVLPEEPAGGLWSDDELCNLYYESDNCQDAVVHRTLALLMDLSMEDMFTKEELSHIVSEFNLTSPFQIYLLATDPNLSLYAEESAQSIAYFEEVMSNLRDSLKTCMDFRLSDYLYSMHLPYISKNISHKLVQGFSDINDLFDELNMAHNQIYLISDRLGLGKDEGLLIATKLYKILLAHEKELRECQQFINIVGTPDIILKPYISDNLSGYYSISDYISKILSLYGDKVCVRQLHRLTRNIDTIVTDKKDSDLELIQSISQLNSEVRIMSSQDYLDNIANLCQSN